MSTILGATGIKFGDGTIQTTKTPAVVSAFTNDAAYSISSDLHIKYAERSWAIHNFGIAGTGGSGTFHFYWYNLNGTQLGSASANCNCNC